jgi:serine/threonine protein kinase
MRKITGLLQRLCTTTSLTKGSMKCITEEEFKEKLKGKVYRTKYHLNSLVEYNSSKTSGLYRILYNQRYKDSNSAGLFLKKAKSEILAEKLEREIQFFEKLQTIQFEHLRIPRYHGCLIDSSTNQKFLVLQYITRCMTKYSHRHVRRIKFEEGLKLFEKLAPYYQMEFFLKVAKSIRDLHRLGYAHMKIRPKNIRLEMHKEDLEPVITNFGHWMPINGDEKSLADEDKAQSDYLFSIWEIGTQFSIKNNAKFDIISFANIIFESGNTRGLYKKPSAKNKQKYAKNTLRYLAANLTSEHNLIKRGFLSSCRLEHEELFLNLMKKMARRFSEMGDLSFEEIVSDLENIMRKFPEHMKLKKYVEVKKCNYTRRSLLKDNIKATSTEGGKVGSEIKHETEGWEASPQQKEPSDTPNEENIKIANRQ